MTIKGRKLYEIESWHRYNLKLFPKMLHLLWKTAAWPKEQEDHFKVMV